MQIDEKTKIIGRFHTKPSPRGLNIYNSLFEEAKINALYVLFYNPDPKVLFDGLRNLNLAGAITAGFESDPRLTGLVDEMDEVSAYIKRVGFVTNAQGKVKAYSQGGSAMLRTINSATSVEDTKLVIVGAGNITKALLSCLSRMAKKPKEIEIYNRTAEKAEALAKEYKMVKKVGSLDDLKKAEGDILANCSHLGGSVPDTLFDEKVVARFPAVADVTFEVEDTNLINLARKLKKKVATGWDMFTYQGQIALETILGQPIPMEILKKHVRRGLGMTVK